MKRIIEKRFKSSHITEEFRLKSFDDFRLTGRPRIVHDAYHCAKTYAENFDKLRSERRNSIALLGRPGSGKTHLLMAIANQLLNQGITVQYFPWVEGFNEIKDDLDLCAERIYRMQTVDVLFMDDMWKGREKPTPFEHQQTFAVINYRYNERKPVLISSERDIDTMINMDEGIGSRINDMCKDFRVVIRGGRELNFRLKDDA